MGCGNSNRSMPKDADKNNTAERSTLFLRKLSSVENRKNLGLYHSFVFRSNSKNNILIFTTNSINNNEFISIDSNYIEEKKNMYFKSKQEVAVGYQKGYKLDVDNQDKFFILIDGNIEVYCLIDAHGPYGSVVGQITQDRIFKEVNQINFSDLDNEYDRVLKNIFENVNNAIIKREEYRIEEYDPYLTGAAVTLIIKKDRYIYSANVGNVMALLFYNDKISSTKYKIKELTWDDSVYKAEYNMLGKIDAGHGEEKENFYNIHKNFDSVEELRRIYECGGEVRKLAGEDKSRIFIKGKYFPGLINSRSVGDQIGTGIGVISTPHVAKITLDEHNNYFLLICTDGISNVSKMEKVVNSIDSYEKFLESVTNIIQDARVEYRKSAYCPDMTIIIKSFNPKIEI